MVLGLDRREVVQDPNKGTKAETQSAPLPAIMKPQHSSFDGVGKTGWEGALTAATQLIDNYYKKKEDQLLVDTKLMYMQGATEEELQKSGTAYSAVGWKMMEANTAMDKFAMQMQQSISDTHYADNPDTFRKDVLSSTFKQITDNFTNADPAVKDLLLSHAETVFPKLMEMQVKAYNEYNHKQHRDGYANALASTTDPADFQMKIRTMGQELSPEERKSIIADVSKRTSDDGNPVSKQALAQISVGTPTEVNLDMVANVIKKESGGNYSAVWGNKTEPSLTTKTVDEVLAYQQSLIDSGAKSTAAGAYQIKRSTLQDYKNKLNLTGKELFDATTQDKLFVALALDGGIRDHLEGKLDAGGTIKALSKVWAAVPMDASGKGYYDGDGLNKAYIQYGEMLNALTSDMDTTKARKVLIDEGFSPEDQDKILKAWDGLSVANSNKWDTDRTMMEESIASSARMSGNFPEAVKQIGMAKQQFGLSDEWANKQTRVVQSQINEYNKERAKMQEIDMAISTGTVNTLSANQQKDAVDRVQATLDSQYPAWKTPQAPNYAHDRTAMMSQTAKFLYTNNITDKRIGSAWGTVTYGNIVDSKTGEVSQAAVQAYSDYKAMVDQTSVEFVNSLMTPKTKDLFILADNARMANKDVGAAEALVYAQSIIDNKLPEGKTHKLGLFESLNATADMIDKSYPSLLNIFGSTKEAQQRWEVSSDSIDKAIKESDFANRISNLAAKYVKTSPIADKTVALSVATEKARRDVVAKTEYIGGTLVYFGDRPTLSQRLGGKSQQANRTYSLVMEQLGPKVYGDQWNNTDIIPHGQKWYTDDTTNPIMDALRWTRDVGIAAGKSLKIDSDTALINTIPEKISEEIRGIQDSRVIYTPTSDSLVIYPYRDYARTATLEPLIIPASLFEEADRRYRNKDTVGVAVLIQAFVDQRKNNGRKTN